MNPSNLLNNAASFLQQKQFEQASKYSQRVLQITPDSAHALYIFAVSNAQLGHKKVALQTFNQLINLTPTNSDIHYNHGIILSQFKQESQAIKAFQLAIKYNPKHIFAFINLGNIYSGNREFDMAIAAYTNALKLNPQNLGVIDNLSKAYFNNNSYVNCIEMIDRIRSVQELNYQQTIMLIESLIKVGNYRTSDVLAKALIEQSPCKPEGFYYHGLSSQKMARYPLAITAFNQALEINNNHIDTLKNLSICLNYTANYSASQKIISNLYELTDNSLDTQIFDYTLKSMNNELFSDNPKFRDFVANNLQNIEIQVLFCKSLLASKEYETVIQILTERKNLTEVYNNTALLFILAEAYDKSEQYNAAWNLFIEANNSISSKTQNTFNQKLNGLTPQIQSINTSTSLTINHSNDPKVIFVIGFPRSGTTLIDSILSSHEEVIVLEEVPLIADLAEQVLEKTSFKNYIKTINNLNESEILKLRKFYFNNISNYHQWTPDQTVVDKSPLNIVHTYLIHILFPESPIIFAVRHPLDVCVSCFSQNFRSNPEMASAFTSIESITQTYMSLMNFWKEINKEIKLNKLTVVYESLVSQTEYEMKKMVEFTGMKWSTEYLDFYKKVKGRGMIHNPSYNQVNQNIYTNKMYRHKNYSKQIEQTRDQLSDWIDYFGYEGI